MSTTRIFTIACWIISALVLTGLLIWFLTGSVFGIGGAGMTNWLRNIGINITGSENLSGPYESQGTQSLDPANINTLNISWVSGEITVTPHDGNDIRITEYAQRELSDNEKMRVNTAGGTLTVSFRESGTFRGNMPRKNLEVLVPRSLSEDMTKFTVSTTSGTMIIEDFKASSISFNSVSATITASNLTSETLNISTTSGTINLDNINTNKLDKTGVSGSFNATETIASVIDINTTSGRTNASGEFNTVEVSSVSGNTTIDSKTVPAKVNMSSVSGRIDLNIPNTESITVHHSAVSGKFSSEIPVTIQSNADYRFSSVSGNTNINLIDD